MSKKTIKYFIEYAKARNGLCLSNEYINTDSKIIFICENNHTWETKSSNVIYNNSWCPKCNKNSKDTISTFKEIAINRGGECLSNEYVNSKMKLLFKCEHNHTWESIPESIKNNNSWCPICGDTIPLSIDDMKEIAKKKNGICLSTVYINNHSNLKWKCSEGHEWLATANRIKSFNTWCPECSGNKRKRIEDMNAVASTKNGKCLSTEYFNAHKNLFWKCEHGHEWVASYHTIKNHNSWCPICNESNGENIIRRYLESNNITYESQKRFTECKNKMPLPFDFHLPNHKILIEYDGIQHYMPIKYFGGEKSLSIRKNNDKLKETFCLNNGFNLIRIPYFERNITEKLDRELKSLAEYINL